jgi:hypothetical protein
VCEVCAVEKYEAMGINEVIRGCEVLRDEKQRNRSKYIIL